MRANHTTVSEI